MFPETNANRRVVPLFSCVSAAVGTGVQGGVSNSAGSHGSSMDGAAGTTSAAGPSVTAAQSQFKTGTASGGVSVVSDSASVVGKPGTTGAQTLNGGAVVTNCHIPGGASVDSSLQPTVTVVNNGPVSVNKGNAAVLSAAPSTIIRTSSTSAPSAVTSLVISSQPTVKGVPTVTLVRPPMQTNSSQSGGTVLTSPAVSVTSTTGSLVNKLDSAKTVLQTGAHVVTSSIATGTTATMRSPTVLQNLRTSVPSPIAATAPGGIRAIAPQVLTPRLAQPQQNAPNIQNIQLPPGNFRKVISSFAETMSGNRNSPLFYLYQFLSCMCVMHIIVSIDDTELIILRLQPPD